MLRPAARSETQARGGEGKAGERGTERQFDDYARAERRSYRHAASHRVSLIAGINHA